MPKIAAAVMSMLLVLVLSSCASLPPPVEPVQVRPARLAPPPPAVMVPRESNFRARLLRIFSPSPTTPTR